MRTRSQTLYNDRHQMMLEYQKNNRTPPTTRQLAKLWGISPGGAVEYTLSVLTEMGKVEICPCGEKYNKYIARNNGTSTKGN